MSLRGLQHSKSNRIEISKGVPSPNEGNNGELRLGVTAKGILLYAKYGNRWYQLSDAAISAGGQFSAQGIAAQGAGTLATSIDRGNQSLQMGGNVVMNGNTVDGVQIATRDAILTSTTATANAALPKYWNQMLSAYKLNNTSTSDYYTMHRLWDTNWGNSDSAPTSITAVDSYSNFFTAPRAGKITNVKINGVGSDAGFNDPFKFYFFKSTLSTSLSSATLTAIATTSAITPPASSGRVFVHTQDFSSSNSFAEGDSLYVWIKKDSNSGSQDLYWSMNISGEYT